MSPAALVEALEARGARLTAREDGSLVVEPRGVLEEADREALRARKAAVLSLLRERAVRTLEGVGWSRVSLYHLNKVLEVATPIFGDVPLILAPGCRIARDLRARDPKPGRVWCVCEVLDLLLTGVQPDEARKVAEAKLALGGHVAGAQKREL